MSRHPSRSTPLHCRPATVSLLAATLCLTTTITAEVVPSPQAQGSVLTSIIPSDGVVLYQVRCWGGGTDQCPGYSVSFVDVDGRAVDGTVVDMSADLGELSFAFRPTSDVPPGDYFLSILSPYGGGSRGPVSVVESSDQPPTVETTLSAERVGEGEPASCQDGFYEGDEFFPQHRISAALSFEASGPNASQYFYSVKIAGQDPASFTTPSGQAISSGEPNEVCFEITGTRILGDQEEVLAEECLPTDPLSTLGPVNEPLGDLDIVLGQCEEPPEGYEDEWCDFFSPAFEAQSCDDFHVPPCMAARRTCEDGDNPPVDNPNVVGGDPDISGEEDPLTDQNGDDESGEKPNKEDQGGCTIGSGPPGAGGRLSLTFFALLLGAAFRRRRPTDAEA